MLRIFVYLVSIVLITAGITGLSRMAGRAVIQVGDTLFDLPSGWFLGLGVALLLLMIIMTLIISGLWRLPKKIQTQRLEARRAKGMVALTRGLEAVAAGDAADAQRLAKVAQRQLDEPGITRLLTAQAAQLAGDDTTAQQAFSAMLEAPETEFLGLRGLYLQAMNAGDRKEARGFAERAFILRPGAEWAYRSVFALNVERGAWGDAREALLLAQQHGLEAGETAKRREAVLLSAQAYAADISEDHETALKDAEAALKRAPGFAPAAVLAARLEGNAGRRSKAARILDEAWATMPHPAIARAMNDLYNDEDTARRAARLKKLAERLPGADESVLLTAEQDISLGAYEAARLALEALLQNSPRARTFAAMGAAMRGLYGADAAQYWLDRAASAPLDPVPGADGVFQFTRDGWIALIREYGEHGRLAPPPIEEIQTSLSADQVRLLTAPPPPPEQDGNDDAVIITDAETVVDAPPDLDADDATGDETPVGAELPEEATGESPSAPASSLPKAAPSGAP